MEAMPPAPGQIVILNGPPRAGKSSIAAALQDTPDRTWMTLGVDAAMRVTPAHLLPGVGLRPGGERSHEVLQRILGLEESELANLEAKGIIGAGPPPA